jgi:hypothetical protein
MHLPHLQRLIQALVHRLVLAGEVCGLALPSVSLALGQLQLTPRMLQRALQLTAGTR